MTPLFQLGPPTTADAAALGLMALTWFAIGWITEHPPATRPSVSHIMKGFRRVWMTQFVTRQPRIFDATMIDSLRQGTAFFASASMIAIGGGVALIADPGVVTGLAADLTLKASASALQLRAVLVVLFLAIALLKFIWVHRLFGYCSIVMAAVPNDPADPMARPRAAQAAEINIQAARNFNRGLQGIYFALGALGWLAGPLGLVATTAMTSGLLLRREFASRSREVLLQNPPEAD